MNTLNTNLVTNQNFDYMKCHIYRMTDKGYSYVQNMTNAHNAMQLFDYENEIIEAEVFAYILNGLEIDMNNFNRINNFK